jgi:hypothetical protein
MTYKKQQGKIFRNQSSSTATSTNVCELRSHFLKLYRYLNTITFLVINYTLTTHTIVQDYWYDMKINYKDSRRRST